MVRRPISLCCLYPPTIHFYALMIAYGAIVKAGDGGTGAPCHDTNVVNSIAVKYNSSLGNRLSEDISCCEEMESYPQRFGWC